MLPHAGWRFSANVALQALMQTALPETVVVIAPKHTRFGANFAVSPAKYWNTPVGNVEVDLDFASQLVTEVDSLIWDQNAHSNDHAIEVLLPLLLNFQPRLRIVPVAIGRCLLQVCQQIGDQLGKLIKQRSGRVTIVVSSDMNHFEDHETTRKKDDLALNALSSRDPSKLFDTVRQQKISMCGVLPAAIALSALNECGDTNAIQKIAYATSADVNGNYDRVVGYASVLL